MHFVRQARSDAYREGLPVMPGVVSRVLRIGLMAVTALGAASAVGVAASPVASAQSAPTDDAAPAAEPVRDEVQQTRFAELRKDLPPVPWWQRAMSAVGLLAMVVLAWLLSPRRGATPWRTVLWGLALQLLFGLFVLKTPVGLAVFSFLNDVVVRLLEFTEQGSRFLFGSYLDDLYVAGEAGGATTLLARAPFALKVLPTIIFFSALMAVFYHLGIMQRLVQGLAWVMRRTMRTSGSETLSAAANIFVGQTEAPLVVRPYVSTMTRSELMAVMVGGFATVAGGVLAAYVGMLRDFFPDIAGHLIAASVMSAPAALVVAKVMLPETETSQTRGEVKLQVERVDANVIEAAARGSTDGLKLALNVAAMLLAFLALVALLNHLLGLPAHWYNAAVGYEAWQPWTMQQLLGYVFWPVAFLMGVSPDDCAAVGALLGEKIVLNEFVAYLDLAGQLENGGVLEQRSVVIATYALCGFANLGSIAIQIGGIGSIAPERRSDLARLGLKAMIGGTLAACMTASVAGLLL